MKKVISLIAALTLVLLLCACQSEKPPEFDTPDPPPLSGTFTAADFGTLTFNGDGKSITVDGTQKFEDFSLISAGKHEGTYVFLYRGGGVIRYDKAETFQITIGGKHYRMINEPDNTGETQIVLRSIQNGSDTVKFEKQ